MATAHLIHGYLGAGKTSFATRLEAEVGGIRLSVDEWYLRLFAGDEPTAYLDPASWNRVVVLLDELWSRLLEHGVDVILDFGFWSRQWRDQARAMAQAAGAEVRLYAVVCTDEVAKARCRERQRHGESFVIDDAAFEALRSRFDPLGPDEPFQLIDTTETSPPRPPRITHSRRTPPSSASS